MNCTAIWYITVFCPEIVPVAQMAMALPHFSYGLILCALSAYPEIQSWLQMQNTPVLWIAEQTELPRSVENFRLGMEDYLVKPVGAAELLARVHMLMRCAGISARRKLQIGALCLVADARVFSVDGKEIPLTMREFDILFGLLSPPDRVFTRKELIHNHWGRESTTFWLFMLGSVAGFVLEGLCASYARGIGSITPLRSGGHSA